MKNAKNNLQKNIYVIVVMIIIMMIVIVSISTVNYPKNMKKMFVQSSVDSMQRKLNDAADFTNENIQVNYEEIKLLSSIISWHLDGTENYSKTVLDILKETKTKSNFENIGILKMDSGRMFATMSDGSKAQVDIWVVDLSFDKSNVSVELQTSPFKNDDKGEDVVVYRYIFKDVDGTEYMLIGEKSQDTLKSILNLNNNEQVLTLVVRDNGNIVYGDGSINNENATSYNVFAYLESFGASEKQINNIKNNIKDNNAGTFTLTVGEERYYFIFHSIKNTNWICINAYSETNMAGKNLKTVNSETMKLVVTIVILLIITLAAVAGIILSGIRKSGQQKVLAKERLFEEMSRYIPSSFVIIKQGEVKPDFISHNFKDLIGDEMDDFSYEGILSWLGGAHNTDVVKKFEKDGKYELTINKGDKYYSFAVYNIGIVDDSTYYVFVFEDVTVDINSRNLLEDSIKRADSASKSKTHFLSKMSHEIRTPLNSVIGFSKLALDRWDVTEKDELYDYMKKIQISGNYLLELVSDILDISRIEEGRMQITLAPARIDELVDEVVDSFQGQMERKNIQFVIDKNYDDIVLDMDSYHIKQILNNLISNAYKYTEEGGCVGLEVCANPIDSKRMSVQFIIQDTGIGMSEEFQRKIFEPFTQEERGMQMKKQLRGSGLGMSICKNLVDLQSGSIRVESELGEGSTFTVQFTFRIIDEEISEKQKVKEEVDYSCLEGKKILVVDDIEMNRIIVEKFLSVYGIVFEEAENGQEAVNKFANSKTDEFFAIFMDVQMPIMNGYEATETIRKLDRSDAASIAIAGMTADAFSDDVNKAMISGMNYHITKPIQIEKIMNVLMEIYRIKKEK